MRNKEVEKGGVLSTDLAPSDIQYNLFIYVSVSFLLPPGWELETLNTYVLTTS